MSLDCEALLFDLDGVLVDSTACIEEIWRRWCLQHGLSVADVLGIAHGRRAVETVRMAAPHLNAVAEMAALVAAEAQATTGVTEVPGARELIEQLPVDRWAVVTSGARTVAEHRLRHVGLPIPAVMVCADEVRFGKPDPEGYLAAATRLGLMPRDCIVVEDAPLGVEAAHAAGMRVIAIPSTYPPDAFHRPATIAPALRALTVRVRDDHSGPRLEIGL
jgi:mannitol-1-/sugar-/sorbitol-6-phosphatase